MSNFRECGECNLCCTGFMSGEVNRIAFGGLYPCAYLKTSCEIYDNRPNMCRNYQCAWSQYILPEHMRPDLINTIVSVERKNGVQYLRAISTEQISDEVAKELDAFTSTHNSFWKKTIVIKAIKT